VTPRFTAEQLAPSDQHVLHTKRRGAARVFADLETPGERRSTFGFGRDLSGHGRFEKALLCRIERQRVLVAGRSSLPPGEAPRARAACREQPLF